jgi:hypothetical protein
MSAILIASDGQSWYESGMTRDIVIRNNTFAECGGPVILIHPENSLTDKSKPVHANIVIDGNTFTLEKTSAVSAKSTRGLTVKDNRFEGTTGGQPLFSLLAVTDAVFMNNDFHADNQEITAENSEYELKA